MVEEPISEMIWCELKPKLLLGSELPRGSLETPPVSAPGAPNHIRIEGEGDKEFWCFTDAHPGRDHEFRVGERTVMVPWDKFQLSGKRLFLKHEVTWE